MPDYGRGKRPITDPDRREAKMRADRDAILAALTGTKERIGFTDRAIRTLVEKGERTAKGSRMAIEIGRRSKGTVIDPTESAASARDVADKVGRWIGECAALLDTAADCMSEAWGRMQLALDAPETEWEAQVKGTDCRACTKNVAGYTRGGYCDACRKAWERRLASWEGPEAADRAAFERERQARTDDDQLAS